MARITRPEDVKLGQWYTMCCHLDLYEVEDDDDVQFIRDDMLEEDEREKLGVMAWETRREALLDLREFSGEEGEAEIDALLAQL